jgi:hypothetical protein
MIAAASTIRIATNQSGDMWRRPTRVPRNELLQSSTNNSGAARFSKSPAAGRVAVPADVLSRGSWLFILLPTAFAGSKDRAAPGYAAERTPARSIKRAWVKDCIVEPLMREAG